MMDKRWPKTLGHEVERLAAEEGGEPEAVALHRYAVFPETVQPRSTTYTVRAPCCNRKCSADEVIDLRGVPGTLVHGLDLSFACSACWTRMIRDPANGWTKSRLWRACGAPADVIREHRAREVAADRIRQLARDGKPFNRAAETERARQALPEGVRELPGTEHPDSSRTEASNATE